MTASKPRVGKLFYKNGKLIKGASPRAVRAFWLFIEQIERYALYGLVDDEADPSATTTDEPADAPKARVHALLRAVLNHLKLVVITLSEDDDAQVIFESLNSKTEPLLAMELVRNNIFQRASAQGEDVETLFENKWRAFEDANFWKAELPQSKAETAKDRSLP